MTTSEELKGKTDATETPRPRRILRSIGAVVAGFLAVGILDTSIDVVMHATGVYPPWFKPMATPLWFLAIGYRMIDGVIGGYIAGRLAPDRPVKHALALGIVGMVLSVAGVVATWSKGPEFGPKWYPLALVVIALPCALIGGKLASRKRGV
jgi:peptidoglycan/LPS O-acetylase OafA/YrhL